MIFKQYIGTYKSPFVDSLIYVKLFITGDLLQAYILFPSEVARIQAEAQDQYSKIEKGNLDKKS